MYRLLILLGHDDCGVMKYAMEHYTKTAEVSPTLGQRAEKHYPEPMSNFSSILKCVYPVFDKTEDNGSAATGQDGIGSTKVGAEGKKCHNFLHRNIQNGLKII